MAKRKSAGSVTAETFPLKLTQPQRESLIEHVFHQPRAIGRLKSAAPGQQVIAFSRRELDAIASEISAAVAYIKSPAKQRLVAVRKKIDDLLDSLSEADVTQAGARLAGKGDGLLQFKVTLLGVEPPVWRRIQIEDGTLAELHYAIQDAMGWQECHLHQFEVDGERYGIVGDYDFAVGFDEDELKDESEFRITDLLPKTGRRTRWRYEYDFGDGWQHEILFEGYVPRQAGQKYPVCLEGERACPPEDCGGSWGYAEFVEAITDPQHERHDELLEWNGPFDPAAFDAQKATRRMREGG